MNYLILALTVVLAESTWGHAPSSAKERPVLNHDRLGTR